MPIISILNPTGDHRHWRAQEAP